MDDLPLYEVKADLFRGLAHPLRVRILELVCAADEVPVADLLTELKLKPPHLSQHLAVLRNAGVVTARREGNSVFYRLEHPALAEMLAAARVVLSDRLTRTREALAALDEGDGA